MRAGYLYLEPFVKATGYSVQGPSENHCSKDQYANNHAVGVALLILLPQLSENEALTLEQGFKTSLSNSWYISMYPWAPTVIYLHVQRYTVKSLSSSVLHLAA